MQALFLKIAILLMQKAKNMNFGLPNVQESCRISKMYNAVGINGLNR